MDEKNKIIILEGVDGTGKDILFQTFVRDRIMVGCEDIENVGSSINTNSLHKVPFSLGINFVSFINALRNEKIPTMGIMDLFVNSYVEETVRGNFIPEQLTVIQQNLRRNFSTYLIMVSPPIQTWGSNVITNVVNQGFSPEAVRKAYEDYFNNHCLFDNVFFIKESMVVNNHSMIGRVFSWLNEGGRIIA
jgi:hypothetical protein